MQNKSDNNAEAVKIANALKPFVKKWFEEWGQSCLRSKKMTVSTAPDGNVVGVTDAFSDQEMFIKYMSDCANASVGDTVWVSWMYNNMQTLFANHMGNLEQTLSFPYLPLTGGTITGDLEVTGDFTGGGVVKSVNSVAPDSSGNVDTLQAVYVGSLSTGGTVSFPDCDKYRFYAARNSTGYVWVGVHPNNSSYIYMFGYYNTTDYMYTVRSTLTYSTSTEKISQPSTTTTYRGASYQSSNNVSIGSLYAIA